MLAHKEDVSGAGRDQPQSRFEPLPGQHVSNEPVPAAAVAHHREALLPFRDRSAGQDLQQHFIDAGFEQRARGKGRHAQADDAAAQMVFLDAVEAHLLELVLRHHRSPA